MEEKKLYHGFEDITDENREILDRQFLELNENGDEPRVSKYSYGYILQEYLDQEVEGTGRSIQGLCYDLKIGETLDTKCGFKIVRIF
jgi:hypothetical protein